MPLSLGRDQQPNAAPCIDGSTRAPQEVKDVVQGVGTTTKLILDTVAHEKGGYYEHANPGNPTPGRWRAGQRNGSSQSRDPMQPDPTQPTLKLGAGSPLEKYIF